MATAYICPPMLRLKRSAQSGMKDMTADWQVLYTESCPMAYLFGGAEIDLSQMQAGDVIDVRVRKQIVIGGGFVIHDQVQYSNAQPATHPTMRIGPIPDVYGVEVAMRQTVGVLRTITTEFWDAKRLGAQ